MKAVTYRSFDFLTRYRREVVVIALVFAVGEYLYLWRAGRHKITQREWLSNLVTHLGVLLARYATQGLRIGFFALLGRAAPLRIPVTPWTFALGYLLIDFLYYWKHRWLHEVPFLWAFHSVHHSSDELNLSTSVRSSIVQRTLEDSLAYFPLALLGFDPTLIVVIATINLASQYWVHTCAVGKLGILEGIVNTPSAHRVHHGENAGYRDKNYGSTLLVWDRLFGTYQAETEPVKLGSGDGAVASDPIRIQLAGLISWARRRRGGAG